MNEKIYINKLKKDEIKYIAIIMATMSYNPSIGRVLIKGGVEKFQKMAIKKVKELTKIQNQSNYDDFHRKWVNQVKNNIPNNKGERCSVGQAQKPINVFLKIYVDWANLPNPETANRLKIYLHVPLDKYIMEAIKRDFPNDFKEIRKTKNYENSLSKINRREYTRWQEFFRRKCPSKPILFDMIWAIERRG